MLIPRVDCITKNLAILITGSFYCVGKYILVLPFAKPSTFRISSAALIRTNIKSSNDIVRTCQLFFYKEDNTFPINLLRTGTFVSLLNNSHHTSFILCWFRYPKALPFILVSPRKCDAFTPHFQLSGQIYHLLHFRAHKALFYKVSGCQKRHISHKKSPVIRLRDFTGAALILAILYSLE